MYELPFYKRPKYTKSMKVITIVLSLVLIPMSFLLFTELTKDSLVMGILSGIVMFILPVFCIYTFFFGSKKSYLELTEEYIKVSTPFKIFKANWNEIEAVYEFTANANEMVGFLLKKDIKKRTQRTVLNNLNEVMGQPPISFNISKQMYSDIDYNMFMTTIENQIALAPKETDNYINVYDSDLDDSNDNIVKAMILSVITAIIASIIYGGSIAIINKNFILIPLVLSYVITSVFNKYYIEKNYNIFVRLWVGLLSAIQIPLGYIMVFLIESYEYVNLDSIGLIIRLNFEDIFTSISTTLIAIVMIIVCFALGFTVGRVSEGEV